MLRGSEPHFDCMCELTLSSALRKQQGPTMVETLQGLLRAGTITVQTLVWKASMGDQWQSIENLPGLHAALADPAAALGASSDPASLA